ncbi:polysaccharide deacetylase family protein [Paenibacillus sp. R14(2021)]|uniref:polysaccharide deacetylase family protein n=1 Tax=Paenibacillus sp. R14(2021) TaxID=2859228 RepID=UPI0021583DD8|nr:polysaccharide deacetylase family protein [Paenibacillus sp. R14(2021)]
MQRWNRVRKTAILLLTLTALCFVHGRQEAGAKADLHAGSLHPIRMAPESSEASVSEARQFVKKKRSRSKPISWVALQQRYPGSFVIWGPRRDRKVALTFDDVPDPKYTPQVLETLARFKVKATFFVVGQRADAYPALVKRMRSEGHIIGNHSYNHPVFSRVSLLTLQQQITRTEYIIRPLAGYSPRYVRPPYGEIMPEQVEWLRSKGYIVVNWDVDSQDWRSLDSNKILINIKKTLQPGSIILQHAGGGEGQDLSGTLAALPRLIKLLQSKGYQIVTLPELLGQSASR